MKINWSVEVTIVHYWESGSEATISVRCIVDGDDDLLDAAYALDSALTSTRKEYNLSAAFTVTNVNIKEAE